MAAKFPVPNRLAVPVVPAEFAGWKVCLPEIRGEGLRLRGYSRHVTAKWNRAAEARNHAAAESARNALLKVFHAHGAAMARARGDRASTKRRLELMLHFQAREA
ncbi:hypothetical protein [Tropicimonas sp. IMCC34043]|uniref:hypothetical protein n=1 Tax=Tropicimonas sp. IMCC34043 TaxID=2248760 RepID=UPI000E2831D7|nr:hypothetical protein [Tropicimonas sp. IMCC34043]